MCQFEKTVHEALCAAINDAPVLLAAVSGGADSTAMLGALCAIQKDSGFSLHCITINHNLRGAESNADARAVQRLCTKFDVDCNVCVIPEGEIASNAKGQGCGIEAAARQARHRELVKHALSINAKYVLLAHTRDDLLETALMRILRGAGPAGLAAMPVTSVFSENKNITIIRPLLSLTRADVIAYLTDSGLTWQNDSTNADCRFLRNRVRLKLIPHLDKFFPYWRTSIFEFAKTQSFAADFISKEAARRITWQKATGDLHCPENQFFNECEILREEALFHAVNILEADKTNTKPDDDFSPDRLKKNYSPPRRSVIRKFAGNQKNALDLGFAKIENTNGEITVSSKKSAVSGEGFSLLIKESGTYKVRGFIIECIETKTAEGKPSLTLAITKNDRLH